MSKSEANAPYVPVKVTDPGRTPSPPQEVWLTPARLATLPKGPQPVGQVGSLGTIMGIRVMTDCACRPSTWAAWTAWKRTGASLTPAIRRAAAPTWRSAMTEPVTSAAMSDEEAEHLDQRERAGRDPGHVHCPDCGCDPQDHTSHQAWCRRCGQPTYLQCGPPWNPWDETVAMTAFNAGQSEETQ